MSDLSTLRQLRREVPDPSPEQLAAQRLRLIREISVRSEPGRLPERERPRRVSRGAGRPRRARGSFLAVIGLAVAATGAATVLFPGGAPGGNRAEAAETLEKAATLAIRTIDPVVAPGQYLRVTTEAFSSSSLARDDDPETVITVGDTYTIEVYVPYDRDEDWVEVRSPRVLIGEVSSEAAELFAEAQEYERPGLRGGISPTLGFTHRAPREQLWITQEEEMSAFVSLPDEPEPALALLRGDLGQNPRARITAEDGAQAFSAVTDVLREGLLPAESRALAYRMLALLPGVVLGEADAEIGNRGGVAIGIPSAHSDEPEVRYEIIVDPASGAFLGERMVLVDAAGRAREVIGQTLVRAEVVLSAPPETVPFGAGG